MTPASSAQGRTRTVALAVLVLGIVLATLPAEAATAAVVGSMPVRTGAAAAAVGSASYIFGGYDGASYQASVLRYDPDANAIAQVASMTSGPSSAVWSGSYVYVSTFEGQSILRFNPANPTIYSAVGPPLPRNPGGAAWIGDAVYLFGGVQHFGPGAGFQDTVLRFRPADGTLSVMGAAMPSPRADAGVATDGRYAYVVGGRDPTGPCCTDVLRYDPVADAFTVLATLPHLVARPGVAHDGTHLYVLGGWCTPAEACSGIWRVDTATGAVADFGPDLPGARDGVAVTWDGTNVHVFSGVDHMEQPTDEIVRVNPIATPPSPPRNLKATPLVHVGISGLEPQSRIRLDWEPPADSGGVPLWRYRVYGGNDPDGLSLLATLPSTAGTYQDFAAEVLEPNYYEVRAVNVGGAEGAPAALCAHTLPWNHVVRPPGGCP